MIVSQKDCVQLALCADLLELCFDPTNGLNLEAVRTFARHAADDFISDGGTGYCSRNGESLTRWVKRQRESGLSRWAFMELRA